MSEQSLDNWYPVASTNDIDEEDVIQAYVGDVALAIYNVEGRFYATSDICTHEHTNLSDGIVIDDVIECPRHQGRFRIPTGKPLGAPVKIPLRTYPVKIVGDKIYVQVNDTVDGDKSSSP